METVIEDLKEASKILENIQSKIKNDIKILESSIVPSVNSNIIFGVNGFLGWGIEQSSRLKADGIVNTRVEAGSSHNVAAAVSAGANKIAVIVGNNNNTISLSSLNRQTWIQEVVTQAKSETFGEYGNHIAVLECINEPYLKARKPEPAVYGKMYLEAKKALRSEGINFPLGFYIVGDYQKTDGTWSQVKSGNGWVGDAVHANPELINEIDCLISHPYGKKYEDTPEHYGPGGMEVLLKQAKSLGIKGTNIYITEFGQKIEGAWPSNGQPTLSQQESQASIIEGVIEEFISISDVRMALVYSVRDNSTGNWGLVTTGNPPAPLPWQPRLSYKVIKQYCQMYK